jgi:hypothetical protein
MNNEFIAQQAARWAEHVMASVPDPGARVQQMYTTAFARPAEAQEVASILAFVNNRQSRAESAVWTDVAHVLFNSAEFLYVQ